MKEDVIIPAHTEKIVAGTIHRRGDEGSSTMVEGVNCFAKKIGLLVGHSLVDIQKGVVPLRILNLLPEPVHLYKGTIAALVLPVHLYSHNQSNYQHVSQICQ